MEIEKLRQFKTIVEAGGLLRAAEILNISGGGLSKSIKVLETELGFKLFQQIGRGLILTTDGKALYQRLGHFLSEYENLITRDKGESRGGGFRIATFEVFSIYFLRHIAKNDFIDFKTPLEIREAVPGQIEDMVSRGVVDAGITYRPIPKPGVIFQKITKIKMGLYGRKSFLETPVKSLPFAAPIAPVDGTPSDIKGLDGWPDHFLARKVLFRVDLMETAMTLCRSGAAVAFLPNFIVRIQNELFRQEFELCQLPLPPNFGSVERQVYMVLPQGAIEGTMHKKFAIALRKLPKD